MDKDSVVAMLERIALLLELKGENAFKCRAYSNAARAIQTLPGDLETLVRENRLSEISGVGEALRAKITEMVTTGKLLFFEKLAAEFPSTLFELFDVPGLGPKKIKLLLDQLGVDSISSLEKACLAGKVAELPGMGAKTQTKILEGIEQRKQFAGQVRYGDVYSLAHQLLDELRQCPAVSRVSVAGSFRRGKEVLKDLDLVASSPRPTEVMQVFVTLPAVIKIVAQGETKSSVLLENGVACDLRVVADKEFASALLHFTGSKEHNVAMRQRAISQGMKLSEWGLFEKAESGDSKPESSEGLIPCSTEEEIFQKLGLDYIPPELRENLGELVAAETRELPRLLEWTDLRGCFHNHTTESDGAHSLADMIQAAADLGLEYLGIADHSKSSFQANGLSEERLQAQIGDIRRWNEGQPELHVFAGSEVDILKDGTLDYDNALLSQLDYVVASIHSSFTQDEESMTRRIIRAIENEHVTMLGHLTGRLLLSRQPYQLNIKKVIEACAANGTWIELNANPWRLDMDWRWWRLARDLGVKCVINPDAHTTEDLGFLRIGVNIARKGWLRKQDVINTLPLREMLQAL